MDLDSFLATPKWDILQIIADKPSSPIEIAEITKTTVSYVSQQLKLLEAIGIVSKSKTGAFLKGKPRNIYSIRENFVHVTALAKGFSEKKKILLDQRKNIILRIWMLDNHILHLDLERVFLQIDGLLPDIRAIYLNINEPGSNLKFVLSEMSLKSKITSEIKKSGVKVATSFVSENELKKLDNSSLHVLFDPSGILKQATEELKGGSEYEKD